MTHTINTPQHTFSFHRAASGRVYLTLEDGFFFVGPLKKCVEVARWLCR